jgi:hypothetical protein
LWQLRDSDEAGQVAQVGAFVVEPNETVVLGIVTGPERLKGFVVASCYKSNVNKAFFEHFQSCIG